MPTFAELLNSYMVRTGIGDAELARRIGVNRLTLVRWKEGVTTRPRHREDVVRCAEELRLTPDERDELLLAAGFAPDTAPPGVDPSIADAEDASRLIEDTAEVIGPGKKSRVRYALIGAAVVAASIGVLGGYFLFTTGSDDQSSPTTPEVPPTTVTAEVNKESPTDLQAYPVAADGEWLILMAPFVNYTGGSQGFNVLGRLREAVEGEIRAAKLADVRTAELVDAIGSEAEAIEAGNRSGATIVIWGEYDSGRVKATFTVPRRNPNQHSLPVVALEVPSSDLSATINIDLAAEVRFAALMTLCELYYQRSELEPAKKSLLQAMASPPSDSGADAVLKYRLGRAYQGGATEDLDEAIWLFTQVLEVYPESLDTLNSRAMAFLDRGREGDATLAIEDLDHAVSINRSHAPTYVNRSRAYLSRGEDGDPSLALSDLSTTIAIDPTHAEAYVSRAALNLERGTPEDLASALEDVELAVEIDPSLPSLYLVHGEIHLRQDDFHRAVSKFSRAISLDLSFAPAFFNRGLAYSALSQWDRSLADLRRAQSLSPRDVTFNRTLCRQLAALGKPSEALKFCNAAVLLDSTGASRDGRGLAYALLGRAEDAIDEFDALLQWAAESRKPTCLQHYSSRRFWATALRAGENAFDDKTLAGLVVGPEILVQDPC